MEQRVLIFGEQYINKNAFHKNEEAFSTDKVEIKRILISKNDLYGKKSSFN